MITNEQLEALDKLNRERTQVYRKAPILKSDWPEKFNEVANVRGVRIIGDYSAVSCGDESEFIILAANLTGPMIEEIRRLRGENEKMRECLEYYAKDDQFSDGTPMNGQQKRDMDDYGSAARDCLTTGRKEKE